MFTASILQSEITEELILTGISRPTNGREGVRDKEMFTASILQSEITEELILTGISRPTNGREGVRDKEMFTVGYVVPGNPRHHPPPPPIGGGRYPAPHFKPISCSISVTGFE